MRGSAPTTPAFTLVELLLVLALMGILAVVAAPRYANAACNYRASMAAQRVAADLALARASAKAASASRTVVFNAAQNTVTLTGVSPLNPGNGSYILRLSEEPYRATLTTLTFTDSVNDGQLVFDGYGNADSGLTIIISAGSGRRRVLLDATTGAISVQ